LYLDIGLLFQVIDENMIKKTKKKKQREAKSASQCKDWTMSALFSDFCLFPETMGKTSSYGLDGSRSRHSSFFSSFYLGCVPKLC
jgi:hypothetical protein